MTQHYGLIADIGGTNARFALAPLLPAPEKGGLFALSESDLVAAKTLSGKAYDTIRDAIEAYLSEVAPTYGRPHIGCLAIACPTDDDWIRMTNHSWQFSVSTLQTELGFSRLRFINDYHALANSLPYLPSDQLVKVGGGTPATGAPMVVTGPGTGLGLASLVFAESGPVTVETEGGHAHFAATDSEEAQILEFLLRELPRVSWERVLSGMGLENLYRALAAQDGGAHPALSAADITAEAAAGNALCVRVVDRFCAILGNYAGDVALQHGARGGLYIAGGIVPRILDQFESGPFRERFEAKARFRDYNARIPTYVIRAAQPGLLGSAAVLQYLQGGNGG